ncbi:MAG TPA: hemolysin family protein [Blastocatellia bacterium]|nr:hemolysin family protein [Blastocatellia bacterium]
MQDHHFELALLKLLLVLLLVLANGFFVCSEFALVSVRRSRLTNLASKGHRGAKAALRLLEDAKIFISVTQFGVTLASLAIGWLGQSAFANQIFIPLFARLMPNRLASLISGHAAAVIAAFAVVTFLTIVLGEITPKALALDRTLHVAVAVARPLEIFYKLFKPFIQLLNLASQPIINLLGIKPTMPHAMVYSEDELRHIVSLSYQSGILNEQERQVIHNVFDFTGKFVSEIMIPRVNVAAIDSSLDFAQSVSAFVESGYSRIPVYRDRPDDIIGVVHSKDLMAYTLTPDKFDLEAIARKPLFIPDTASLDEALRQMEASKSHFGIVVDEHGSFDGIVTLEDLLEEIVGEIRDEYDEGSDQDLVVHEPDGSIVVAGWATVRDVNRALGLGIPESDDYNTVAGFLLSQSGKVLSAGDAVDFGQFKFIAETVERHRVVRVRIKERVRLPRVSSAAVKD